MLKKFSCRYSIDSAMKPTRKTPSHISMTYCIEQYMWSTGISWGGLRINCFSTIEFTSDTYGSEKWSSLFNSWKENTNILLMTYDTLPVEWDLQVLYECLKKKGKVDLGSKTSSYWSSSKFSSSSLSSESVCSSVQSSLFLLSTKKWGLQTWQG